MEVALPTLAEIEEARQAISGVAIRTPLVRLGYDGPAEIYLKLENLQPIGSFKIRGAMNAHRPPGPGGAGARSGHGLRGQHGPGRRLGREATPGPCTVMAPDTAPRPRPARSSASAGAS